MRVTLWLEELRDDLKFAFRQLKHSPGFTLVATLTLALGIGANSAIFALVDATLLRPLPYGEPDRLVAIWENTATTARSYVSPLNMLDWNARSRTFEKIAGFTPSVGGMVMAGADGNAETVSRQWVTAGIFDVLGVTPIAGRTFSAEDEAKRANVVVLSEAFWRTRFNSDPGVIGRELRLDGIDCGRSSASFRRDFQLLGQTSMWAMRPLVNLPPRVRGAYVLQVVGRMKPGVSIEAAAGRSRRRRRQPRARIPADQQGPRRRARTAARLDDRQRSAAHVDAVPRRRRFRAPHLLRQRRQPAARTRDRAQCASWRCGRRSAPAARRIIRQLLTESLVLSLHRWRAGSGSRRRNPERGALAHSAGPAAPDRHAHLRHARRRLLRRHGAAGGAGLRRDARVEGDGLLVGGSHRVRQPQRHRRRRTASRAARHRRGRDRRASAVRRRAPASDADGRRRLRSRLSRRERALDARRSARARSTRPPSRCSSSSIRSRPRSPLFRASASVALGERSAARFLRRRADSRSRSSAIRPSTTASGRAPSIRWSARRISRHSICRSSRDAPSIGATHATAFRVCIVNEAFARSFQRPIADRPASGAAAGRRRRRRNRSCARSSASRDR